MLCHDIKPYIVKKIKNRQFTVFAKNIVSRLNNVGGFVTVVWTGVKCCYLLLWINLL